MNKIHVPFVNLGLQYEHYREEILDKLDSIGRSGHYIGGEEIVQFEQGLAKITDTPYAIAVGNGSDALSLILKAYGIGRGDEVITVPNSFIASAGAIADVGAIPRFCDVGEDYNLDPDLLSSVITTKTKAIIPVHLTGNPAHMDRINEIARSHGIKVIEDAAQAIGATYNQRAVGSLGDAAAFSLHPLKNFHLMGDAGFISTSDHELYQQLKKRQNHGLKNRDESEFWGQNSRIDAIQAAVGNIKLRDFDKITERFRAIASFYHQQLSEYVQCPVHLDISNPVYHNFVIQVRNRSCLMDALLARGVETKIHYPIPLHLMESAQELGYVEGDFVVAEQQAQQILSLPIYPELTDTQVEFVTNQLVKCIKEGK